MDGISIAKMQEAIGVRETVEDVDFLRMMLGFDHVKIKTPKVEVRLRSAGRAQIPLQLSCAVGTESYLLQAILTFPTAYPAENLLVEVTDHSGMVVGETTSKLQEFCACSWSKMSNNGSILPTYLQSRVSEAEHSTAYPRAVDAINYLRQLMTETAFVSPEIILENSQIPCNDFLINDIIDKEQETSGESSSSEIEQAEDDKYYSCMVCGHYLFHENDIEKHYPTQKDADRRGGKILPCSSVFTSCPPSFMDETKILENTVKIACIKCRGKLGLICWTGSQCSCGAWITPAFQYINSKVDLKRKNFDILSFTNLKSSQPKLRN